MHTHNTDSAGPKERPLVSVIIPTRNRAGLLQEAVASVLAQEGAGEEFDVDLIVVDDASSDGTAEIVRGYPGIRYFRLTSSRGMSATRNVGIKASKAKYVAFLDDDDLMLAQRLKLQVSEIEAHPEVGVVYSQNIIRGKSIIKIWRDAEPAPSGDAFDKTWPDAHNAPSGDVFHRYLMQEFISVDTPLVRREAFEKAGYFDESLTNMEHYDMFLRLAFHVPFLFVEGNVAINRVNPCGAFQTRLAGDEGYARMLPRVIEKALAMLPVTDYSRRLRREVHMALVPRICCMVERLEAIEAKRLYVRTALQSCPWILRESPARALLVKMAYFFAAGSTLPVASVKAICREIKAAAAPSGVRERWQTRLLLADIWTEVSMRLGFGAELFPRAAGYAAARAGLYDVSRFARKEIMWLIARAVIGPRAHQIRALIKGRWIFQAD